MKQKLLICGAAAFAALFLFSGIMLTAACRSEAER